MKPAPGPFFDKERDKRYFFILLSRNPSSYAVKFFRSVM